MGALVTLNLTDDSPMHSLPWIITVGPLDDSEEWEPVVCGPYLRSHALSLAGAVVADQDLMAVVEPLVPHVSADEIRKEIENARAVAAEEPVMEYDERDALDVDEGDDDEDDDLHSVATDGAHEAEPPTADQVRAGFARIAAQLTAVG